MSRDSRLTAAGAAFAILLALVCSLWLWGSTLYHHAHVYLIERGAVSYGDPLSDGIQRRSSLDALVESGDIQVLVRPLSVALSSSEALGVLNATLPRHDIEIITGNQSVVHVYLEDAQDKAQWTAFLDDVVSRSAATLHP